MKDYDKTPCHKCGLPLFADGAVVTFETVAGVLRQVYYHFACYKEVARKQPKRGMRE